jgi:hypothetical protein
MGAPCAIAPSAIGGGLRARRVGKRRRNTRDAPRERRASVLRHQPSPPGDSAAGTARRASRGCRQVFGLVDSAKRSLDHLLVAASRGRCPSACRDFVSTYRCGAAPVFDRLPFSSAGLVSRGTDDHKISRFDRLSIDDIGVWFRPRRAIQAAVARPLHSQAGDKESAWNTCTPSTFACCSARS